jgi:hypothetical protein
VNDNDAYVTLFEQHDKIDDSTIYAGSEHNDVKLLTHELVIPDKRCGDWAEEIEDGMNYTLQDEYSQYKHSPTPHPTPNYPQLHHTSDYCTILNGSSPMCDCDRPDKILGSSVGPEACDKVGMSSGM